MNADWTEDCPEDPEDRDVMVEPETDLVQEVEGEVKTLEEETSVRDRVQSHRTREQSGSQRVGY